MNKNVEKALNEQINAEMSSAYLYLSMSTWADKKGYKGIKHWMKLQAQEEMMHAMKLYDFILERNGNVEHKAIDAPTTQWKDVLDLYEAVLTHEQTVTNLINNLYDIALTEKDHASSAFLQWFVNEQVEEEANVCEIIDQLKLAGSQGPVVYMIDKELGSRVLATPAQ